MAWRQASSFVLHKLGNKKSVYAFVTCYLCGRATNLAIDNRQHTQMLHCQRGNNNLQQQQWQSLWPELISQVEDTISQLRVLQFCGILCARQFWKLSLFLDRSVSIKTTTATKKSKIVYPEINSV